MPARYPNLPRVDLITLNGQLLIQNSAPLTESVLIVGPALDGPVDRPVRVNNAGEVEQIFGPVVYNQDYQGPTGQTGGYSGNAAMKAVREVQSGGCADIRVLRVGGSLATGTFTFPASYNAGATGTILLTAPFNGRIYNSISIAFTSGAVSGQIVVSQPTSKGGSFTIAYSGASSGTTVGQLIDAVNSSPFNRGVHLSLGTVSGSAPARKLVGTATLAGGTDGTINDDLATGKFKLYGDLTDATTGSFLTLADTDVDNVYLAGIYIDDMIVAGDPSQSITTAFTAFLGQRTIDNPMLGFIGTKPLADSSSRAKIATHFAALTSPTTGIRDTNWSQAGYFMNTGFILNDGSLQQPIDAGSYLQTVAADVLINDPQLGIYLESAAGIYAGTVSSLPPHQATTHKQVNGIYSLPYEFTRAQLNSLVGGVGQDLTQAKDGEGAYVTIQRIENHGVLWTLDVTSANRDGDFKDLQPLRIANAVHKNVKALAFPYLGRENSAPIRNSLQQSIKQFLDGMASAGALLGTDGIGYSVDILGADSPQDRLMGTLRINIMLRPNFEIKTIAVTVRLSL